MTILQALALGAVQGITEFLPISSSGHLILLPTLFNWPLQPLAFDVALHLGTLVAVTSYFRSDIIQLARGNNRRLFLYILIGIIPTGIAGVLGSGIIETKFRSATIVALNLIVWGVFLIGSDIFSAYVKRRGTIRPLTGIRALILGCAQVFSLIPGTSRSGVTIGAGVFAGLSRNDAARFSFLMSIPLIAAAGLFKLRDVLAGSGDSLQTLPLLVGFATSALVGWLAIAILMKTLSRLGLTIYGIYRVVLAALILLFL